MSSSRFAEADRSMTRSEWTCNTMGTASTMASMAEALGMALSGNAAFPAVDSRRGHIVRMSGRRIVQMVKDDLKPSDLMVREAFKNAIVANAAIGGSTNAVIHLLAIAGRVGVRLTLDDWDVYSLLSPAVVNLMPTGKYLMEFFYAGGLLVVIRAFIKAGKMNGEVLTASGKSLCNEVKDVSNHDIRVIRPFDDPVRAESGLAVLRGNLTPTQGAVIKLSAASARLLKHKGRAAVFNDIDDYRRRVDDPNFQIDETSIMVLRGCGPKGYPGMAEVVDMQIPAKLLRRGVTDMVRISDARMSGTAFGTVVLHVCPEGIECSPLAVVKNGDFIKLDVPRRRLHLDTPTKELQSRLKAWRPTHRAPASGYARLHDQEVEDATKGCNPKFLVGCRGCDVPKDSH
jgi:L-arabonate dehydrase